MIRAGIERAERVAAVRKIERRLPDGGVRRVGKIDEDQPADAGGHLIHEAAGLAEIDVLGILADLRDLDGGAFFIEKQLVADRADQNLECGGGRQTGAGQDGRADSRVKAVQLTAALRKRRSNAAHERGGRIFFFRVDGQIIQIDLDRGIALGRNADDGIRPQRDLRRRFQIDSRSQHAAVLMVGMVAADLRAAWRGKAIACLHMQTPPFPPPPGGASFSVLYLISSLPARAILPKQKAAGRQVSAGCFSTQRIEYESYQNVATFCSAGSAGCTFTAVRMGPTPL